MLNFKSQLDPLHWIVIPGLIYLARPGTTAIIQVPLGLHLDFSGGFIHIRCRHNSRPGLLVDLPPQRCQPVFTSTAQSSDLPRLTFGIYHSREAFWSRSWACCRFPSQLALLGLGRLLAPLPLLLAMASVRGSPCACFAQQVFQHLQTLFLPIEKRTCCSRLSGP